MKKYFTILSILIAGFTNFTYGSYLSANLTISASLNGAQETPAVTTNAFGAASFVLNASRYALYPRNIQRT